MPSSRRISGMRSITISVLFSFFFALARSQQCFYPDGETVSATDIPCDASASASPCCRADQFCLKGGLCFGGGITSRASCTDKTWNSVACATACTTADTTDTLDEAVPLTPCTALFGESSLNKFVCGLDANACQSDKGVFTIASNINLVLRPAQVAALVETAISEQTPAGGSFSIGTVVGVALGIGIPSIIGLAVLWYLLRREKRKSRGDDSDAPAPPKTKKAQYKLPDGISDEKYVWTSEPPAVVTPGSPSPSPYQQSIDRSNFPIPVDLSPLPSPSIMSPVRASRASSVHSGASEGIRLTSGGTLVERYAAMKQNAQAQQAQQQAMERHELESTPSLSVLRYELGEKRMS